MWAQNFSGFAILIETTSPHFLQNVYITGDPKVKGLPIGITLPYPFFISPLAKVLLPQALQVKLSWFIMTTPDKI